MGDNFPLQKGPLGVEGSEVFLFDSIHSGTLGTPASCEYSRSLDNPIRGNAVHPDALVSEFDGEQSDLVRLVSFCCAIRNVCWTSKRGVLARDVDDVTTESLINHNSRALTGHKKGTSRQYIVLKVPVIDSRLGQRSTQEWLGRFSAEQ